jgi:NAD(P)-dependent dehydrogenase (short-subunit alcohol dehydrogenase family)
MEERRVAFVTGASRGIGKGIAIHLARAGFDVAITARTVEEGERREHSSTAKESDTTSLPGSLRSTAAAIEAEGAKALVVPADLLDRTSLGAAATTVLERWGRCDVLVNNARYIGPGHMDLIADTPLHYFEDHLEGNAVAPMILIKQFLPGMLEKGGGTIINVSSAAGISDPPAPAGKGGWGLGYAWSKGAAYRIAGILAVELGNRGIRAYNLEPGYVVTERIVQDMSKFGFQATGGVTPDVPGAVCAWLVTNPAAAEPNGRTVHAPNICKELGLLPADLGTA